LGHWISKIVTRTRASCNYFLWAVYTRIHILFGVYRIGRPLPSSFVFPCIHIKVGSGSGSITGGFWRRLFSDNHLPQSCTQRFPLWLFSRSRSRQHTLGSTGSNFIHMAGRTTPTIPFVLFSLLASRNHGSSCKRSGIEIEEHVQRKFYRRAGNNVFFAVSESQIGHFYLGFPHSIAHMSSLLSALFSNIPPRASSTPFLF